MIKDFQVCIFLFCFSISFRFAFVYNVHPNSSCASKSLILSIFLPAVESILRSFVSGRRIARQGLLIKNFCPKTLIRFLTKDSGFSPSTPVPFCSSSNQRWAALTESLGRTV